MSTVPVERRHQVFVSSTYVDLVPERLAVIQALLELDCIPVGMEMFPAADDDQWTLIKEVIESCDYYVVIVGGRYGSVTAEGVSFTEKEYDYAVELGLPVLGFVHADPGSIPVDHSEIDEAARKRLDGFRKKVMTRMVKTYSNPDELASVVSRGLVRAMKTRPRPGWVRGDNALTDAVRAEIAELRAALAEAEKQTAEAVGSLRAIAIDESFAHGADSVTLSFRVESSSVGFQKGSVELEFTWDQIVGILGPHMLNEASDPQLRKILNDYAMDEVRRAHPRYRSAFQPSATISGDSWGKVLVQLRALGIISAGTKKRTVSDKAVYWALTAAGDAYLVRLMASKRSE